MLQFVRIIRTWSKIRKVLVLFTIIYIYVLRQSYLLNDDIIDTLIHILTTYNHIAHLKTFLRCYEQPGFWVFSASALFDARFGESDTPPLF